MAEPDEARKWHGLIRSAVRECIEAWLIQSQGGPITKEALEGILGRSSVLLLQRLEGEPPEVIIALLPILIRTMLAAFVEVMAEQLQKRSA